MKKEDVVTIKELADYLEVSPRTIHRDLKSLEDTLEKYQLSLSKKSGIGIQLEGLPENKQDLELALFSVSHTDYTPEERQAIILSTLLETSQPIKLFTLASELSVTIATVSNDLEKLDERLTEFDLDLLRKRGYGVQVEGSESNKRSALSHLISQYIDEFDFISIIQDSITKKSQQQLDTVSNRLLGLVDREKLLIIERSVDRVKKDLTYDLADSSYIGLVVHLALALERLKKGDNIKFDPGYLEELKGTKEFGIASKMIEDLEKVFQMTIPKDEIGYITMHLMGAKLRYDRDYMIEESSIDIAYKARELTAFVSGKMNTDLLGSTKLLSDLVAHLKPTIYRIKQGMKIKNPLSKDIEDDYPDLFSVIEQGVTEVFQDIKFPREEIAYLVLHFASTLLNEENELELKALVVCSSGIGTSKMLASSLTQLVPEIKEVENQSFFKLNDIDLSDYQLIVSTIPLQDAITDYILVSPILTKEEIQKVRRHARKNKLKMSPKKQVERNTPKTGTMSKEAAMSRLEMIQQYSNVALRLLDTFGVNYVDKKLPVKDVLSLACHQLSNDQYMDEPEVVLQHLLEREKLNGLGIPNTSLALYHTRSESVKKPIFTIYALTHPIEVMGMDGQHITIDTVLLMFSPIDADEVTLDILSYISGLIIRDEDTIHVFQSKNEAQISQFLSNQLNEFINEKL